MRTPQDLAGGSAAPDSLPPALVAYTDYDVLRRLGCGGMGVVYLARNRLMNRLEALKLSTAHGPDPGFLREVQAAARLAHPNIVAVYSARVVLDTLVLAMEYVDGCDLWRLVARRGRLPVPSACELIRQAAVGLQHAHDAGLVHRDIKPSNLLVDSAGVVKVLDMGLARFSPDGQESVTKKFDENMVMGTADYLAPEQAINLHNVDARVDIYSLGATLYALLAGEPPFPQGTVTQKLLWHQLKDPVRLDQRSSTIPAEVADIVGRMM